MPRPRRPELAADAAQRSREQLARLGGELRASRLRRHLTQRQLGARVGLSQSTISLAERGRGGSLSIDTWQRVFTALGRRLVIEAGRDPHTEPADAGHLAIQELVLRLARAYGVGGPFELPTRPSDPARSADVCLRDDRRRRLALVECWNVVGDVGAAARSTSRKATDLVALAAALGGERPYDIRSCWVVRATAANRALVARYTEVFGARFPGSSVGWVRALTSGAEPPAEPGFVWSTIRADRLLAWRRR